MSASPTVRPQELVRSDRVHRRVYLDPEIFAREMEEIFGHAWVFVGHDSQIPNAGDFITTSIGAQPVVMARHGDGKVHVLFNRCGHRGALVVAEASGRVKQFRCGYHGWSFHTDGSLAGIPLADGYGSAIDLDDPSFGMIEVPRTATYHGFVFASLAADGPSLREYLGEATIGIDDLIDRAPDGEIELVGGVHKYYYRGNWKLQTENVCDQYHPPFGHASSLASDGRQFNRRAGDDDGRPVFFGDAGMIDVYVAGVWSYPSGHSSVGSMRFAAEPDGPVFRKYRAKLVARHGEMRTREILAPKHHNMFLYPNLVVQQVSQHLRVIRPVAVDLTEVSVYAVKLKGAPDEMHTEVIRYLNITHAAASLIQTDDLETFERCQRGLATQGTDWVLFARGAEEDRVARSGTITGPVASEAPMRGQFKTWLSYMTDLA